MSYIHTIDEYIPIGRENAISCVRLCRITGFNRRKLQHAIELRRRNGAAICAAQTYPTGFYIARNTQELQEYIDSLYHREAEISRTRSACQRTCEILQQNEIAMQEIATSQLTWSDVIDTID